MSNDIKFNIPDRQSGYGYDINETATFIDGVKYIHPSHFGNNSHQVGDAVVTYTYKGNKTGKYYYVRYYLKMYLESENDNISYIPHNHLVCEEGKPWISFHKMEYKKWTDYYENQVREVLLNVRDYWEDLLMCENNSIKTNQYIKKKVRD